MLKAILGKPVFTFGKFKEGRKKYNLPISKYEKCFFCNHLFTDGEEAYLGCVSGKGNIFFCKSCAEKYDMGGE